jgi:hypothetical protein
MNSSLPSGFAPSSRVWIYQGHRPFTAGEAAQTRKLLTAFVDSWASHGTPVKGFGDLLYSQFILLLADETASGVSGCSTDSSVRLIKEIQQHTGIRLFDRLDLAFYIDGQVQLIPMTRLQEALDAGRVTPESLHFNNTVQTKEEWETKWLTPLRNTWVAARYLNADTASTPASRR